MRKRKIYFQRPAFDPFEHKKLKRRIIIHGLKENHQRDEAFRRVMFSIPPGKVSTYGRIAAAAGYPLYHRAVASLLRRDPVDTLPWHRVVGAGGQIKTKLGAALEQRKRLKLEGAKFSGKLVDMSVCEHTFRVWEIE